MTVCNYRNTLKFFEGLLFVKEYILVTYLHLISEVFL